MSAGKFGDPCNCRVECMDVDDEEGTCKGLPMPPKQPLVEIVLVRRAPASIPLTELVATVPPGHRPEPWTWEDEERDVRVRLCLCCGQPGHYQETVEALIAAGKLAPSVCIGEDGRLHDGHHRVIAAKTLGIERVTLETKDEADSRWQTDHGSCVWELRQFGDVHPGEAWSYVQNFRQAARDFVTRERSTDRDLPDSQVAGRLSAGGEE